MWTYSIDYDEPAEGPDARAHGSTMVAADRCIDAVELFMKQHPKADIAEVRRVRHD